MKGKSFLTRSRAWSRCDLHQECLYIEGRQRQIYLMRRPLHGISVFAEDSTHVRCFELGVRKLDPPVSCLSRTVLDTQQVDLLLAVSHRAHGSDQNSVRRCTHKASPLLWQGWRPLLVLQWNDV